MFVFCDTFLSLEYQLRVVCVTRSLALCTCICFVDRCLSFCPFSFDHCVVCSSSIYGFSLHLWCLQTRLGHGRAPIISLHLTTRAHPSLSLITSSPQLSVFQSLRGRRDCMVVLHLWCLQTRLGHGRAPIISLHLL
jgi:hypothetical protein